MEKVIQEISYELWKSIAQLDKTFVWDSDWDNKREKVDWLLKMLDIAVKLNK